MSPRHPTRTCDECGEALALYREPDEWYCPGCGNGPYTLSSYAGP